MRRRWVAEICRAAAMSRATFYRRAASPTQLLADALRDQLRSAIDPPQAHLLEPGQRSRHAACRDRPRGPRRSGDGGDLGDSVVGHVADVTDEEAFAGAIAHAIDAFGTIDAVFNVAGGSRAAPLIAMSMEDWDFTFRLNLYSVFVGTKLAANQFIAEGKPGAIVNVTSLNPLVPMHFGAGYTASRAGAAMLTRMPHSN